MRFGQTRYFDAFDVFVIAKHERRDICQAKMMQQTLRSEEFARLSSR